MPQGCEIERKYLLAGAPDERWLRDRDAVPVAIEQVYLRPTEAAPVRRVRRLVTADGAERFRYTEKRAVRGIVREERERDADAGEARALIGEADADLRPIRKTRWTFGYAGHNLELDVFDDPPGLVLLEVELERDDERVDLPPELAVVRDVSEDPAYLNVNLARRAPQA